MTILYLPKITVDTAQFTEPTLIPKFVQNKFPALTPKTHNISGRAKISNFMVHLDDELLEKVKDGNRKFKLRVQGNIELVLYAGVLEINKNTVTCFCDRIEGSLATFVTPINQCKYTLEDIE